MRLLQANKILLGSCVVVLPISFYAGLAIKERYLAQELDKLDSGVSEYVPDRASKARIVQLQQERAELLEEGRNLDTKIAALKKRMEGGSTAAA